MNEPLPLTDTTRTVLACVRDHPGCDSIQIAKLLAIDDADVQFAIDQLLARGLVVSHPHKKLIKRYLPQKAYLNVQTYYPA